LASSNMPTVTPTRWQHSSTSDPTRDCIEWQGDCQPNHYGGHIMTEQTPAEQFAGKVAVITGASAGIGSGFARQAAALGMKLVLADVAEQRLDAIADELRDGGAEVEAVRTDVADPASVEALAARAYERFGAVDMLINNAGIMAMGFSWEISAEKWDAMLRINIGGYVNGLRAFVP